MASTAERQKRLEEMRARAKEKDATKDRAPFAPKKNAPVSPGSKVRAENKTTPKHSQFCHCYIWRSKSWWYGVKL